MYLLILYTHYHGKKNITSWSNGQCYALRLNSSVVVDTLRPIKHKGEVMRIIQVLVISLLSFGAFAQDTNVFESVTVGFKVTKPSE